MPDVQPHISGESDRRFLPGRLCAAAGTARLTVIRPKTLVHNAFCVEGVSGLGFIFSTTLAMAVFSMTMITFRAALHPVRSGEEAAAAADGGDGDDLVMYEGSGEGGADVSEGGG